MKRTVFQRSTVSFLLAVIVAAAVISTTAGTGIAVIDEQTPSVFGDEAGETMPTPDRGVQPETPTLTPVATETRAGTPVTSTPADVTAGYDKEEIEMLFVDKLNAKREERDLSPVSQRGILTEMGEAHAAVMAREDTLLHEQPDGTTIEDRYRARGLLPECRLSIPDSEQFYSGAETAGQTRVDSNVMTEDGTVYIGSEEALAEQLLRQWMNSPSHRKPMMLPETDEVGLGLNITADGKVWAALEMC